MPAEAMFVGERVVIQRTWCERPISTWHGNLEVTDYSSHWLETPRNRIRLVNLGDLCGHLAEKQGTVLGECFQLKAEWNNRDLDIDTAQGDKVAFSKLGRFWSH